MIPSITLPFLTQKPRLRTLKRGRNFKLKNYVGEVLRPNVP